MLGIYTVSRDAVVLDSVILVSESVVFVNPKHWDARLTVISVTTVYLP